jgi:hypothetical protein
MQNWLEISEHSLINLDYVIGFERLTDTQTIIRFSTNGVITEETMNVSYDLICTIISNRQKHDPLKEIRRSINQLAAYQATPTP